MQFHRSIARIRCMTGIIIVLCIQASSFTAVAENAYRDAIADLFERFDQADRPGVIVAIIDDGEMVYLEGFGMGNIEKGVPIDGNSMFNIASVSKQFTAGTIAKLHLDGKLSIEDPVGKYVPDLPAWSGRITISQLVHHQSGIPDIFAYMGQHKIEFDRVWGNADLLPLIRKMELAFEPDERFEYSNTNYVLLAEIVQHVTGQTLRAYTTEHFFAPLGMTRTRIDDDLSTGQDELVVSYNRPARNEFEPVQRMDVVVGDGNVVTSANDFAKWDAYLRDASADNRAWYELMHTHGTLKNGEANSYAFGLIAEERDGREIVFHGGSWLRFRSQWIQVRDPAVSVIVFGNHGGQTEGNAVLDIYLEARADSRG